MDDCCDSFGGKITIEVDGVRFSARGDITLDPSTEEVTADANHDGTPFFTSKPKLPTAAFTFSHPCGLLWRESLSKCKINVTIVELSNNRRHLFTGARFVGRPSINLSSGEVTGMSIAGRVYQQA